MSDEAQHEGLHIDSDWKTEAAQEKENLAEQEQEKAQNAAGPQGPIGFLDLVNLLAMQAAVGLGGLQGPDGEQVPANPALAKHYIDLLDVLQTKTEGNVTDEEKKMLGSVLYELRMQFVQFTQSSPIPPPGVEGQA